MVVDISGKQLFMFTVFWIIANFELGGGDNIPDDKSLNNSGEKTDHHPLVQEGYHILIPS